MIEALAVDVGSDGHGWCVGRLVEGEKPEILAAGWATHADMTHRFTWIAQGGKWWWGTPADAASGYSPSSGIGLVILEEFHHLGKPIFKAGALTLRNSGFLAGLLTTRGRRLRPEVLSVTFPEIARWLHLSGSTEAVVQRVVIESYPATGGGSQPQIGTLKEPGPLYPLRLASKTYPDEVKTRNHHKAALAALCYGAAVWAGEVPRREDWSSPS